MRRQGVALSVHSASRRRKFGCVQSRWYWYMAPRTCSRSTNFDGHLLFLFRQRRRKFVRTGSVPMLPDRSVRCTNNPNHWTRCKARLECRVWVWVRVWVRVRVWDTCLVPVEKESNVVSRILQAHGITQVILWSWVRWVIRSGTEEGHVWFDFFHFILFRIILVFVTTAINTVKGLGTVGRKRP